MRPTSIPLRRAKAISWARPRWTASCCSSRRSRSAILASLPLVVALPADQITPDLVPQLAAAIHRYCAARIEDNLLRIRHSRLQHSVGLAIVFSVVVAAILLVVVLVAVVFTDLSALAQGMIAGAVCVFSWVILWDPLEALLFEWVEPTHARTAFFAQIQKMRVIVQAQE